MLLEGVSRRLLILVLVFLIPVSIFADCKTELKKVAPDLGNVTFLTGNDPYCYSLIQHARAGTLPPYEGIYAVSFKELAHMPGADKGGIFNSINSGSHEIVVKTPKDQAEVTLSEQETFILMGELSEIKTQIMSVKILHKDTAQGEVDLLTDAADSHFQEDGNWVIQTAGKMGEAVEKSESVRWKSDSTQSAQVKLLVSNLGERLKPRGIEVAQSPTSSGLDLKLERLVTLNDVSVFLSLKVPELLPLQPFTNNPDFLRSLMKHAIRGTLLPNEHALAVTVQSLSNIKGSGESDGKTNPHKQTKGVYVRLINTTDVKEEVIGSIAETQWNVPETGKAKNLGTFLLFGKKKDIENAKYAVEFHGVDDSESDELLCDRFESTGREIFASNGSIPLNNYFPLHWESPMEWGTENRVSVATLNITDLRTLAHKFTGQDLRELDQSLFDSSTLSSFRYGTIIDYALSDHLNPVYESAAKAIASMDEFKGTSEVGFAQTIVNPKPNISTDLAPHLQVFFSPELRNLGLRNQTDSMAIALIFTNGQLSDLQRVMQIFREHLDKPIGVIFVGIGESSFGILENLDLVRKSWHRNSVEFVKFKGASSQAIKAFQGAVRTKLEVLQQSYLNYIQEISRDPNAGH